MGATNSAAEVFINKAFDDKLRITPGDSTASPGSATLNTGAGKFAIASGAGAATITNSYCRTSSIVIATLLSNDSTLTTVNCVPGNGSFVCTGNGNANADCKVGFVIIN